MSTAPAAAGSPVTVPPRPLPADPAPSRPSSANQASDIGPRTSDQSPQTLLPLLQARWAEIARAALRDAQVELAAALTASAPVALAGELLTVELPEAFCAKLSTRPELAQQLETLVQAQAGRRLRVVGRPRGGQGGDERSRRYREAQDHPLVKHLLTRFEADIVAREIITHDEWLRRGGK